MRPSRLRYRTSFPHLFMTLPSIGQSITGGISPTPSHQAIGRNGSFWLPEKIDPSFESKVKNATPSKEGAKQGTGKSVVSGNPGSGGEVVGKIFFPRGKDCGCRKDCIGSQVSECSAFGLVEIRIIVRQGFPIKKSFFRSGPVRPPLGFGASASWSTDQNHSEC